MKIIIITGAHGAQLAGARRHYRRLDEHTGESLSLSLFIFVIMIAIPSSISILMSSRGHYRRLDEHTGENSVLFIFIIVISISLSLFIFVIIIAITSSISIMMNSNAVKSRRILTFENVCLQNGNHGRMCSLKAVISNTVFSTQLF